MKTIGITGGADTLRLMGLLEDAGREVILLDHPPKLEKRTKEEIKFELRPYELPGLLPSVQRISIAKHHNRAYPKNKKVRRKIANKSRRINRNK